MHAMDDPSDARQFSYPAEVRPKKSHHPFVQVANPVQHSQPHNDKNSMNDLINQQKEQRAAQEEEDFKNTWKKAPRVSKKLPSAFGNVFQRSSDNIARKPILTKASSGQEAVQNIEHMVEIHEYKQVANLLSPLKQKRSGDAYKSQDDLILKKKPEMNKHKNPLLPLKNYLLLSKISEELKEKGEVSEDKLEKLNKLQAENAHRNREKQIPLKLSSMITLTIMKSSHESGCVKKMLHAPTLKLYAVKEEPLNTREARNNLKEWITSWQSNFENSKHHLKVHQCYWNSPEGCVSIVMEMTNNGSLQNLLESVGNLPERALKSLTVPILSALDEVHNKLNAAHGVLTPSQILFDRAGNVKLSLGISQRTNTQTSFNHSGLRTFDKISLHEITPLNSASAWQKQLAGIKDPAKQSQESFYSRAQDIYNFGFLLLLSAVGGLEFFESSDLVEKLKIFLEEYVKKGEEARHKHCCIIHDEEIIASMKVNTEHKAFSNKGTLSADMGLKHISIINFLQANKISREFVDFLCACLRFEPTQRASLRDLKAHPFITGTRELHGPNVSLNELIKISTLWTKNFILPPEYQVASEKQLDRVCEALSVVLPNSDRIGSNDAEMREYYKLESMDSRSTVIQALAEDLGLPPEKVWKRIEGIFKGFSNSVFNT